jgi:oxygen-independent coproporphyrinogen-3 oxidase
MPDNPKDLSIYVHWPFCLAKCPYCDFNSHVRDNMNETDMAVASLKEIDHYAALIGRRDVKSIFFGRWNTILDVSVHS